MNKGSCVLRPLERRRKVTDPCFILAKLKWVLLPDTFFLHWNPLQTCAQKLRGTVEN